jgi:hypothetical protein
MRLSEKSTTQVSYWICENRVIEEIEDFGSQLKIDLFTQFQAATQGEICLKEWKSSQSVAT